MAVVDFVFTNPGHHYAMMRPVAAHLRTRGHDCRLISVAELRGFRSPSAANPPVVRAIPWMVRRSPSTGESLGEATSSRRKWVQKLAWHGLLGPRLHALLRHSDVVVVPNDAVFPYAPLASALRRQDKPFVLMQEGIRFPLPNEHAVATYGRAGARKLCCWGVAAAEHFGAIGVPASSIAVTGNPRYDDVQPAAWRQRGDDLLASLGLTQRPLLFLSNPVEDQGFCTADAKMVLFARVCRAAATRGLAVIAKLHPRENVDDFRRVAAASGDHVRVLASDIPLFAVLAAGRAALVLASTVGLEALLFGLPLGVLALPGHGHIFEYVEGGAAHACTPDERLPAQLVELMAAAPTRAGSALLDRHLSHLGEATQRVAAEIEAAL